MVLLLLLLLLLVLMLLLMLLLQLLLLLPVLGGVFVEVGHLERLGNFLVGLYFALLDDGYVFGGFRLDVGRGLDGRRGARGSSRGGGYGGRSWRYG